MFNHQSLIKEANFKAVRSGGKGGQNVNKVSTKVELSFDVFNSGCLSDEQKEIISNKLSSKISSEGILRLTCESERSQFANKQLVSEKFLTVIQKALTPKKKRHATKVSAASKEKRIKGKKEISEKKSLRKKVGLSGE